MPFPDLTVRRFRFDEDIETIRLNHLGRGILYRDLKFTWYDVSDGQGWRRPRELVNRPLFIDGKPSRFDALQGGLDDSWLMSVMDAITMDQTIFKHVVPLDQTFDHDYVGAYHFRIWKLGVWYDVVVDDYLPVWEKDLVLCYAHSKKGNVFWAALLEKAYAKFSSVVDSLRPYYDYDSLNFGDSPMIALHSLTGGIVENCKIRDFPRDTVKFFLNKVYEKRGLMICACSSSIDKSTGLVTSHSYPVTKIVRFEDNDPDYHGLCLVRLMNPWGNTEWQGAWSDNDWGLWKQIDRGIREKIQFVSSEDGEFWMEDDDFVKFFERIRISHSGPDNYLDCHKIIHSGTWSVHKFPGEWVKDINAGGGDLADRHKNPQYIFKLVRKAEVSPRNNFIIEICHWSKNGREVQTTIGFYIYSLWNSPSNPLDSSFFMNNEPLNNFPAYPESEGRAFSMSMGLSPGEYCIVPCTAIPNVESQFLLRIFSENHIIVLAMNDQIRKSLPEEEQNLNECDEGVKRLFNYVAQGQDEIDWIGLKEILETAINPKRSFLGSISSFLQYIREVFGSFLPFRSSNDYETSAVVFSKDECRSMIAMLDENHSGKLSFSEFSNLWNKICFWTKVYDQHRDEAKGHVTVDGLRDALGSIGYNVSKRTVISLSYVYANEQGYIFLADFILCGVKLETVLSLYEKEAVEVEKEMTFTLENWVKNTLFL